MPPAHGGFRNATAPRHPPVGAVRRPARGGQCPASHSARPPSSPRHRSTPCPACPAIRLGSTATNPENSRNQGNRPPTKASGAEVHAGMAFPPFCALCVLGGHISIRPPLLEASRRSGPRFPAGTQRRLPGFIGGGRLPCSTADLGPPSSSVTPTPTPPSGPGPPDPFGSAGASPDESPRRAAFSWRRSPAWTPRPPRAWHGPEHRQVPG